MTQARGGFDRTSFPLRGIIGVVAADAETELQQAQRLGLSCVEIRADLLQAGGSSEADIIALIEQIKQSGLGVLFTARHPSHGGQYRDSEPRRAAFTERAIAAGADCADLEWGSVAADSLLAEGAPLIVSHHDFDGMLEPDALARLSDAMHQADPIGVKIVPTAQTLADAARMLNWVGDTDAGSARIGFAMGGAGAVSRILTTARGAPISYASFGAPVAPGQLAIERLVGTYRAASLTADTAVIVIGGGKPVEAAQVDFFNQACGDAACNCVGVDVYADSIAEIIASAAALGCRGIEIPASEISTLPILDSLPIDGDGPQALLALDQLGNPQAILRGAEHALINLVQTATSTLA